MSLLILGIFLFILLVVVHEYGHFIVAKRNGVDVEEFGVGFPPKLFGKTMGKGIFRGYYSVNALPLGGFVRLKGEHDSDTQKGSYGSVNLSAKMRIMLAGVMMNLIVAIIMFTVVAWVGMPQLVNNQFTVKSDTKIIRSEVILNFIEDNSPAAKAGLKSGDNIASIDGQKIENQQQLHVATKNHAGQNVKIIYDRDGSNFVTSATLLTNNEVEKSIKSDNPKGYLGVGSTDYKLAKSTWSAPIVAVGLSVQLTGMTLKALALAVANLLASLGNAVMGHGKEAKAKASAASQNVSGPVGIYAIFRQGSSLGFQFTLFVVALISLTLAIMNVLPIPALDGGRVAVTAFYHAIHRPLLPKTEEWIHGTGFAVLMGLFLLITVVDVKRFF
ncbi:MAG: M50 family metallopeptidase [Candidatus Saccharibacteria bacterium]